MLTQIDSIALRRTLSEAPACYAAEAGSCAKSEFLAMMNHEVRPLNVIRGMAQVFKPLTQGDQLNTRQFGGTGLGLNICKRLVALMRGTIGVKSKEGEGSVFWFSLPPAKEQASAIHCESRPTEEVPMQAEVLVVDDNKFNLRVMAKAIEMAGLLPILAQSANEATARFLESRPALMVIDIHMPLINGFELLSRLADIGDDVKDIPTIIVTGDTQIKDTSQADGYRNINLVYKPIEIDEFIDLVQKKLGL